jgi:hypothetical protein
MSPESSPTQPRHNTKATWNHARHVSWLGAQIFALGALALLGWLLARLVWLYYFFGLFFFLVAGLLVGAIAFRIAKAARPIEKRRLVRGVLFVGLCSTLITVLWESRHFADTVGQPPKFAEARNAATAAGRPSREVQDLAAQAFRKHLHENYSPDDAVGYVMWAVRAGQARLTVNNVTEAIVIDHKGWVWIVRTLAGAVLLLSGLWFSLESLRSPLPVTNVLSHGEEILEEMQ